MMSVLTESFETLAADIKDELPGASVELTCFPSGGAMLDVRRSDSRAFVLAHSPAHGFGVDEIHASDGFINGYRFAYSEFAPAAEKLKELANNHSAGIRPSPAVTLNLVVIQAGDIEATRQFYECLGLDLKREQHGRGPEHFAAEAGSTVFEVYPCRGGVTLSSIRIGFEVPFLEQTISALRRQSAKILTEPQDSPWGRRAVVQDPNGNRVELTERR
jgi:predicted enzyme related to lactoylglutathione lyase